MAVAGETEINNDCQEFKVVRRRKSKRFKNIRYGKATQYIVSAEDSDDVPDINSMKHRIFHCRYYNKFTKCCLFVFIIFIYISWSS